MHSTRPSYNEICKRLNEARLALNSRKVAYANFNKVVGELNSIGVDSNEVWELISELITEISVEDYVGGHPPKKNYEPYGADADLWAFCWESPSLSERMYLKFSLKNDCFYYVSLHKSRFKGAEEAKNEMY